MGWACARIGEVLCEGLGTGIVSMGVGYKERRRQVGAWGGWGQAEGDLVSAAC